ncbi:HAD family hydrolase [archaeon]|nr:HAD family hydrolase [archaeon]
MIRALLFDFDGTISDARKLTHETMYQILKERGYNFDEKKFKKLMGVKTREILKGLNINGSSEKINKVFYRRVIRGAKEGKLSLCVSIEPLKELKKEKIKLIVVSNSHSSFIKASVKALKIKKLFHETHGAETFTTKDKLLEKLFKKMKIRPVEAMYIGDRFSDVKYAREAGCYAVAIHNKCAWSTKAEVLKEKPDFLIKDFSDLKRIVDKLNSVN